MKSLARLASALAALLFTGTLHAQVPQFLNHQGRVAVNGVNFDGTGQFKFALVDAAGTTTYWSNDGTSTAGSQPTGAVTIAVSKGLYSVLLGNTALANMTAVPTAVFLHPDVRLRVWFNDGTNGSQLITPDQRIAAVGYAMAADHAATVYGDGSAGDFIAAFGVSPLEPSNPQFDNFTVPAGSTIHVPSGLTIRCKGTFTNSGTIIVDPAESFGPGISRLPPSQYISGKAYPSKQLKTIFSIGLEGGGTGFGGTLGGGALRVFAQGILTNTGAIRAIGGTARVGFQESGGGGGVVILASGTSLTQNGVVNASGGQGSPDIIVGDYTYAACGSGGGGLIRLLAPQIASTGQNIVFGGARQPTTIPIDPSHYLRGSAGGASAGDGAGYSLLILENAGDGLVLRDLCNPAGLLGN